MKLISKIKYYTFSPQILALVIGFLWQWKQLDFLHIRQFQEQPVNSLFGLAVSYGIGLIGGYAIHRLFASSDFVTESGFKSALDELIEEASFELFIVSPYLDPGNVLVEKLLNVKKSGVEITLIHNSNQLKYPKATEPLSRLINNGVKVYNHPRLHAKIYLSEKSALIGSLNLVSGSYVNSFEAGVVHDSRSVREKARSYILQSILESDLLHETNVESLLPVKGYCMLTKVEIPYNPKRPVEYEAYNSQKKISGDLVGTYCHSCGAESNVSVSNPVCINCIETNSMRETIS